MRTKTLLAAAAVLAAGFASSLAQSNVYSLNVVGYVNKVLVGTGRYSMIANPLNTTSNTLGGVLTGSLPTGSQVLKFDPVIVDYVSYTRVPFGNGWSPVAGATASFNPGEGIFVLTPAASGDITNTFVGEVLQGSLTNAFQTGYKMTGNLVPDSGAVTNASIGLVPPNSSQILKLDSAIQDFVGFTKVPFGSGWTPTVPNIDVAEGFFVNAVSPFNWVRNFTVQ